MQAERHPWFVVVQTVIYVFGRSFVVEDTVVHTCARAIATSLLSARVSTSSSRRFSSR